MRIQICCFRGNRALQPPSLASRLLLLVLLLATAASAGLELRAAMPAAIDFREVVNRAKDRVFPTVVFIKCVQDTYEAGDRQAREVSGSGVVISPDGEVISNWHVVEKALKVRCLLQDGRAFPAEVVGSDKDADVALLRLQLPPDTPPLAHATLGDSDAMTEGDFVMAMGAPWGLARSVSIGIISCTRRYLPEISEYSCWLQTDAAISPGNSGGPLINTAGEVIGINTRGANSGGDLGFAVPSNVVGELAARMREKGRVNWSWSGLQLQPLRDFDRDVYFDAHEGIMVAETAADSPARRAGFRAGDRIVRVNGQPVTGMTDEDLPDIRRLLGLLPSGSPTKAEIVRAGATSEIEFTPRPKGAVEGADLDCPRWDFTVKAINRFASPTLHLQRSEGVYVFGIRYPGNAMSSELRQNDILLRIDREPVKTIDDVRRRHQRAMEQVDRKHRVILQVLRNGLMRQVVLDFSRDYDKE